MGEESEASLSEGVTKLVNPGNRNRCWPLPYSPGRLLSCLSESSSPRLNNGGGTGVMIDSSVADTFLVRRRATLVSNRLNTPVRSLLPLSLAVTSVTLTSALCLQPRVLSLSVNSSQRGEEEGAPLVLGFPIDLVADRIVRCKRLNGIGVDSDDEGSEVTSGCANLE